MAARSKCGCGPATATGSSKDRACIESGHSPPATRSAEPPGRRVRGPIAPGAPIGAIRIARPDRLLLPGASLGLVRQLVRLRSTVILFGGFPDLARTDLGLAADCGRQGS